MISSAIFTEQLGGRFHFPDTTLDVQSDAAAIFWCVVLGVISGVIMYGFYYLYKYVSAEVGSSRRGHCQAVLTQQLQFGGHGPRAHRFFMWCVNRAKLDKRHQLRIAVGTAGLVLLFILVPATMFWGTMELQFILSDNAATLPVRAHRPGQHG